MSRRIHPIGKGNQRSISGWISHSPPIRSSLRGKRRPSVKLGFEKLEDRITPTSYFQLFDAIRQASVAGKFFGQQIADSPTLDYNLPIIGDPLGGVLQDSIVSTFDNLFTSVGNAIFEANKKYDDVNDPDGLQRIKAITDIKPGTVTLVAKDPGELSFKYTTTVANAYLASLAKDNIREEFGLDKYLGDLDLKGLSSRTLNLNPTITIEFGSIDAGGQGDFFLGGGSLIAGARIEGTPTISNGSTVELLGSDLTADISGARFPFQVTFNVGLGGEFDKFMGDQLNSLGQQVKRGVGGFVDMEATFKAKLFGIPFIQWTPSIRFTLADSGFDSPTDGNGITVDDDDASFDDDNKDDVGKAMVGDDPTERPPARSRWVRQSAESPTGMGTRRHDATVNS